MAEAFGSMEISQQVTESPASFMLLKEKEECRILPARVAKRKRCMEQVQEGPFPNAEDKPPDEGIAGMQASFHA